MLIKKKTCTTLDRKYVLYNSIPNLITLKRNRNDEMTSFFDQVYRYRSDCLAALIEQLLWITKPICCGGSQ